MNYLQRTQNAKKQDNKCICHIHDSKPHLSPAQTCKFLHRLTFTWPGPLLQRKGSSSQNESLIPNLWINHFFFPPQKNGSCSAHMKMLCFGCEVKITCDPHLNINMKEGTQLCNKRQLKAPVHNNSSFS